MKITKQRLLAAAVIFIVASILVSFGNVDMTSYFSAVFVGMAAVALIAFLFARPQRRE